MNTDCVEKQLGKNTKFLSNRASIKRYANQSGWTFWSMLFVMAVVLFFSYVGMQLVPLYMSNANVKNAMQRSMDDVDLSTVSRAQIIRKMNQQLFMDGSGRLLNYKTDLKVRRSSQEFIIETHYQREIKLFFNLYIVAKFDNVETRNLSNRNRY